MASEITTIGRVERVDFPTVPAAGVPARVDTGAQTSAIWASATLEKDGRLRVLFFGPGSPFYTAEPHYLEEFDEVTVVSSNGTSEQRYKIHLTVRIAGKRIRSRFTLADRSSQEYPVLIGRNALMGKFVVDVKQRPEPHPSTDDLKEN